MNHVAEQRERVLDAWARGEQARPIGAREGIHWKDVCSIVRVARYSGDPRAVNRSDKKLNEVDNSAFYTRQQLQGFDYAFKTALLAAIAAGLETAEIGVYRWKKARA